IGSGGFSLASGVRIDGASGNIVAGNYIGLDWTGLYGFGNGRGIYITDAPDARGNLIGTDGDGVNDLAEANFISGNDDAGVVIENYPYWGGDFTIADVVAGNFIGTDASGKAPLPNVGGAGNLGDGVRIDSSSGGAQILGNTIAFNRGAGVAVLPGWSSD